MDASTNQAFDTEENDIDDDDLDLSTDLAEQQAFLIEEIMNKKSNLITCPYENCKQKFLGPLYLHMHLNKSHFIGNSEVVQNEKFDEKYIKFEAQLDEVKTEKLDENETKYNDQPLHVEQGKKKRKLDRMEKKLYKRKKNKNEKELNIEAHKPKPKDELKLCPFEKCGKYFGNESYLQQHFALSHEKQNIEINNAASKQTKIDDKINSNKIDQLDDNETEVLYGRASNN